MRGGSLSRAGSQRVERTDRRSAARPGGRPAPGPRCPQVALSFPLSRPLLPHDLAGPLTKGPAGRAGAGASAV